MNLYKEFLEKDIKLIENAGINIEDKNYSNEELYELNGIKGNFANDK